MKSPLLALPLLLAACGAPLDDAPDEARQAASTDAWQGLYALRASGTSYVLNPLGSAKVSCAYSVFSPANPQPECTFGRVTFTTLPLSAARRQQVIDRVAAEPAEESRVSVIVKGRFVIRTAPIAGVREFQVLAAYMAPSARTHGAATWYVGGAPSGGYYPLRTINSELTGLTGLTLPTRLTWVGPVAERPASYPVDSVVALARIYSVGGAGSFGPFAADLDQRFLRVVD